MLQGIEDARNIMQRVSRLVFAFSFARSLQVCMGCMLNADLGPLVACSLWYMHMQVQPVGAVVRGRTLRWQEGLLLQAESLLISLCLWLFAGMYVQAQPVSPVVRGCALRWSPV
jgi:hypothetical protein